MGEVKPGGAGRYLRHVPQIVPTPYRSRTEGLVRAIA